MTVRFEFLLPKGKGGRTLDLLTTMTFLCFCESRTRTCPCAFADSWLPLICKDGAEVCGNSPDFRTSRNGFVFQSRLTAYPTCETTTTRCPFFVSVLAIQTNHSQAERKHEPKPFITESALCCNETCRSEYLLPELVRVDDRVVALDVSHLGSLHHMLITLRPRFRLNSSRIGITGRRPCSMSLVRGTFSSVDNCLKILWVFLFVRRGRHLLF